MKGSRLIGVILFCAVISAMFVLPFDSCLAANGVSPNVAITVNPERPGRGVIKLADDTVDNLVQFYSDRDNFTFVHLAKKLKGMSQILTPISDTNRSGTTDTPAGAAMSAFLCTDKEYFRFRPDTAGTVYVLSCIDLSSQIDSRYYINNYTPDKGWIRLADNIAPTAEPVFLAYSSDWRYVPYWQEPVSAPYYAGKAQWSGTAAIENARSTGMQSPIRTPAVLSNPLQPTDDAIAYYSRFSYAYYKDFEANTDVSLPVVGTYASNENILVLIRWKLPNTITSLDINAPSNLIQHEDNMSPVDFTATPVASGAYYDDVIEWYVDGVKQPENGLTLRYTPYQLGYCDIYAKVADTDIVSETRRVSVQIPAISGGMDIHSIKAYTDGTDFRFSAAVTSDTAKNLNVYLVKYRYNGGLVLNMDTQSIAATPSGTALELRVPRPAIGETVYLLVWDENMSPIIKNTLVGVF